MNIIKFFYMLARLVKEIPEDFEVIADYFEKIYV